MISMGVDIGTTTVSIVLLNSDTNQLICHRTFASEAFITAEQDYLKIQDPDKILRIASQGMKEITEAFGKPDVIGMTGQMHGMLYIDASGMPVSPLYTWQDGSGNQELPPAADLAAEGSSAQGRGAAENAAEDCLQKSGLTAAQYLQNHGLTAATGYGLTTYFYHCATGQVPASAAAMVTISDYIAMRLCRSRKAMIAPDMAASWGCFDPETMTFCEEKMRSLGMDPALLPTLCLKHEPIGSAREKWIEDVPILLSLGDNQASYLGSVRDAKDAVLVNVGTGAQVSYIAGKAAVGAAAAHETGSKTGSKTGTRDASIELRPYIGGSVLMAGASLCGGRAYAMVEAFYRDVVRACARDEKSEKERYEIMEKQARAFMQRKGIDNAWKVQPTFAGTRNDPTVTGSISGITVDNFEPGAMTLGTMEGMIRELHEMYLKMCERTGKKATALIGSGNAIRRNALLREITEMIFGMKMTIPDCTEEAAYGAALNGAAWMETRIRIVLPEA